jgi:Fe2+ transport system protein FeoA
VSDEDSELLQHATKLGLLLGRKLAVKEKRAFDGSMVVKVGTKAQFISQKMARSIFVQSV